MSEDCSFERFVADNVAGQPQGTPLPDDFYDDMHSFATTTRQRPEWLALIKEPPMRTNSRVMVGSPTVRVMAILAATFLLIMAMAAIGVGAQRLLAADGPIIVAKDGSGDHSTIQAAVDAAEDGDEIIIKPGTYVEAVLIDKDLTLNGDGEREDIVISAPGDGPLAPAGDWSSFPAPDNPYAILVVESDAEVAGLTLVGERSALQAVGGAPVFHDLLFQQVGRPFAGTFAGEASVVLAGSTTAELRTSTFEGGGVVRVFDRADVTIADNAMTGGSYPQGSFGDGAVVSGNEIVDSGRNCITIIDPTTALLEGNTCRIADDEEAFFFVGSGEGRDPVIRGNVIEGAGVGIDVPAGARPVIEGNELIGNALAIFLRSSDATVSDNVVRDGAQGILVSVGGSPEIRGNQIVENSDRGVWIRNGTTPTFVGNEVCGNAQNVVIEDEAEPVMSDNQICEDAATE